LLIISCCTVTTYTNASEVVIENVKTDKKANGTYSFSVTLSHADKSWDHYANLWQVETVQGEVLARRVLHHPHVNEQPFTRSLSGVKIPKGINKIVIKAGCNIDGLNSKSVEVRI